MSSFSRPRSRVQTLLGGRTVAYETSEVRPQVNGLIRRRYFTEGSYRPPGPAAVPDRSQPLSGAGRTRPQANVASARATAEAARTNADRYRPLAAMEAVSKQDYTDAAAQARQAPGRSRAERRGASTPRGSTFATPAFRRRSAAASAVRLFTVGALVTANQADPLARDPAARPDVCRHPAIERRPARAQARAGDRRSRSGQHPGAPQARGRQRLSATPARSSSPRSSSTRAPAR